MRNGSDEIENLQLAHKACNSRKCDQIGFSCAPVGEPGSNRQMLLPGMSA